MNYLDLQKIKKMYAKGKNITEFLRKEFKEKDNTIKIIEITYDLQSGSYIEHTNLNRQREELYANELAGLLEPHLSQGSSLLDVGTGELTTLSLLLNQINIPLSEVFAFDTSWSRLYEGIRFYDKNCTNNKLKLRPFVANIHNIPLPSKSVDVTTSSHALEPNGNNLNNLLNELFRVTKRKCVCFEPSYELNSNKGRSRMDKLGYIKNIEGIARKLGGHVLDVKLIKNTGNPLNPTACFVIEPPKNCNFSKQKKITFTVPGTDMPLVKDDNFFTSSDTGLVFPVLKNIPILKSELGILATTLFGDI